MKKTLLFFLIFVFMVNIASAQVLWNKQDMNDTQTLEYSEIGANMTWVNIGSGADLPEYTAGYFGNGTEIHARASASDYSYIRFNSVTMNGNAHTYEFWIMLPYNVVDGIRDADNPSDGSAHVPFNCWKDGSNRISIDFIDKDVGCPNCGLRWLHRNGGSSSNWYIGNEATFDMTANTWYHWAFVYNRSGINGTAEKTRFYLDGVLIANSTTTPNAQANTLWTCDTAWNGASAGHLVNNTFMDNIKLYSYDKTDFSDRIYEDGSPPSAPALPNGTAMGNIFPNVEVIPYVQLNRSLDFT